MVLRAALTDEKVKNLKPAPAGRRYHVYDADPTVPGFGVRVTERGPVSFILYTRFAPGLSPARALLAAVADTTTDRARRKAEQWLAAIRAGLDPRSEEKAARVAAREPKRVRLDDSFRAVAGAFIETKQKQGKRRVLTVEREINRHLVTRWGNRAVSDITSRMVVELLDELVAQGKNRTAHNVFGHARSVFGFAISKYAYGVTTNPCAAVKANDIAGEKAFRKRTLSDEELFALWSATGLLEYPASQLYRLLLLTGGRLNEVAGARWREFNPDLVKLLREHQARDEQIDWATVPADIKLWTIPEARFKSKEVHLVPLSDDACRVIETLPRFKAGDHLFSVNGFGAKPLGDFSAHKKRVDEKMLGVLARLAGERGDEPRPMERWVNHDIRRTVRTRLSQLRVPSDVAEMVVGHALPKLHRTYNQHDFLDERREALEKWAGLLRSIAEPKRAGVPAVSMEA